MPADLENQQDIAFSDADSLVGENEEDSGSSNGQKFESHSRKTDSQKSSKRAPPSERKVPVMCNKASILEMKTRHSGLSNDMA